jgi:hypothetical protein
VPASRRRLRVLHYIGTWTSGTGVDTFVPHLAAAQREVGVDSHIGCDEDDREEFLASARAPSFPYFLVQKPGKREPALLPRKLKTALNLMRRVAGLVRFIAQNRINIFHLHSVALSSIEAHIVCALTRTPIVVTHHATIEYR